MGVEICIESGAGDQDHHRDRQKKVLPCWATRNSDSVSRVPRAGSVNDLRMCGTIGPKLYEATRPKIRTSAW